MDMLPLIPLMERFGITYLQPYQILCIDHILSAANHVHNGDDSNRKRILILPTGYGKTLCFSLPALLLPGITMVIYPLRSLMADQERRFKELNIPFAVLQGGQTRHLRLSSLSAIGEGKVKVLITNPETLETPEVRRIVSSVRFSHIVIDEAHVISQWGKSFRPVYARLGTLLSTLSYEQLSAFTATADRTILHDIREVMGDCAMYELKAPPDRPNIKYSVIPSAEPFATLLSLLNGVFSGTGVTRPVLVFVQSRAICEWIALRLRFSLPETPVRFYHAGLENGEKGHIEHWFYNSRNGILIATSAYGMGIDKKDIRTVIHFGIPENVPSFLQESGRAGRDKENSVSIVIRQIEGIAQSERSHGGHVAHKTADEGIHEFLSGGQCRRRVLMGHVDAQIETCSGCDVCDGTVRPYAPEDMAIMDFVSKNKGIFLPSELIAAIARHGSLPGFDRLLIGKVIRSMLARSLLRTSKSVLGIGRVVHGPGGKIHQFRT